MQRIVSVSLEGAMIKRMIATSALVLICATAQAATGEGGTNHCAESKANQKWAKLAQEHKGSDVWQRLYPLRIGLCAMVARDAISLDRATKIFERQRHIGIQQIKRNAHDGKVGA